MEYDNLAWNQQVNALYIVVCTVAVHTHTGMYVPVCTSMYWYVLHLTGMYQYVPECTGMY
jgi:hypothetical protein